MTIQINGENLFNMPWQDRPSDCGHLVWRDSRNPILGPRPFPGARSVYNSAVMPYEGRYVGVFRMDYECVLPSVHLGWSEDGVHWQLDTRRLEFMSSVPEGKDFEYGYDPRLCRIDDSYYVIWCNGYYGPTIGIAETKDFKTFRQLENAFLPFNRNGVLFSRKINGLYGMLSRPSGPGHNTFGDIFYSASPDLCFWGRHRLVMQRGGSRWQRLKIGAGPVPIETSEGWLTIYHGVMDTCNGFVYSAGVVLLDLEEPWKIVAQRAAPILWPEADYEVAGHVPNVVFPCATLCDAATGRIAIYYGAADTHVGIAYTTVEMLLDSLRNRT